MLNAWQQLVGLPNDDPGTPLVSLSLEVVAAAK